MKRKALKVVLVLACVCSLTACGKENDVISTAGIEASSDVMDVLEPEAETEEETSSVVESTFVDENFYTKYEEHLDDIPSLIIGDSSLHLRSSFHELSDMGFVIDDSCYGDDYKLTNDMYCTTAVHVINPKYEGLNSTIQFISNDLSKDVYLKDADMWGYSFNIQKAENIENIPTISISDITWGSSYEDIVSIFGDNPSAYTESDTFTNVDYHFDVVDAAMGYDIKFRLDETGVVEISFIGTNRPNAPF